MTVVGRALEDAGASGLARRDLLEAAQRKIGRSIKRDSFRTALNRCRAAGLAVVRDGIVFSAKHAGDAASGPRNSNGADHKPAPSSDFENRDEPRISPDRLDLLNVHKAPLPGGGT
jgi:hypothetical protein